MEQALIYLCYTCENLLWMWGILRVPVTHSKKRRVFACVLIVSFFFLAWTKLLDNNLPPFEILFECCIVLLIFSGQPAFLILKYLFSFFYMGILTTPLEFLFFLASDVWGIFPNEFLGNIILEVSILLLIAGVVLILHRYSLWEKTVRQISWQHFLIGFFIGTTVSMISSFNGSIAEEMSLYVEIAYTTAGFIAEEFVYLFGVFLLYQSELRKKYQKESAQKDELLKKLEQYYISLEKHQTEIRKLRHDMKKHFGILHHFLEDDRFTDAQQYLEELESRLPDRKRTPVEIGNDLVSAVIENEKALMSEDIKFTCTGLLCDHLEISAFDLCTIFSNLLSNAREACEKLEHSEKEITLQVGGKAGHFELTIKNPIEWLIDIANISTFTSKDNPENHGLGLLNVIETVDRYNGLVRFSDKDQQFEVYISI